MATESDKRREALRAFMAANNLKPKPWAKSAKVAPATLWNFLNKRSESLTQTTLEKLAVAANAAVTELLSDKPRTNTKSSREIVSIKTLDVRAAAGGGYEVAHEPEGKPFQLPRELVGKLMEGRTNRLRGLYAGGDSMYPTIRDGDAIVVLHDDFVSGEVHVLWDGRGLSVKRVEALPGVRPRFRISSDNEAVSKPFVVDADEVRIIGRVVWRAGGI